CAVAGGDRRPAFVDAQLLHRQVRLQRRADRPPVAATALAGVAALAAALHDRGRGGEAVPVAGVARPRRVLRIATAEALASQARAQRRRRVVVDDGGVPGAVADDDAVV